MNVDFRVGFCSTLFLGVIFFGFYFQSWHSLLLTCLSDLIISVFIDPDNCTMMWLEIVCGTYKMFTYRLYSPIGLRKVMERAPVWCSLLSAPIGYFSWYIISFNFIAQDFLCWFLTYLFSIYSIIIHWSWNLSSVVIANCLWAV